MINTIDSLTFTLQDKPINVYLFKSILFCFVLDSSSNMYLYELPCGNELYVQPLKLPEKVGDKIYCDH